VPVGYLVTVALVALGTLFALVPLRSVGNLSFRLGLLLDEVPIVGFYWLLIWTSLAFVQGDIDALGGWATVGLAVLTTAGLAVVAWRGLQARPALEQALAEALGADWRTAIDPGLAARLRRRLPLARILLLPLSRRRLGVERMANLRYGDAGRRPAPRPPDRSQAGDRLGARPRPRVRRRSDAAVRGGQLGRRAHGVAGRPHPERPHLPARLRGCGHLGHRRHRVERLVRNYCGEGGASSPPAHARSVSTNPVVYAELPGAQHAFDLFHSLRFEMVVDAIEAFAAWVRSRQVRSDHDLRLES
jgi:hypothetical protein